MTINIAINDGIKQEHKLISSELMQCPKYSGSHCNLLLKFVFVATQS